MHACIYLINLFFCFANYAVKRPLANTQSADSHLSPVFHSWSIVDLAGMNFGWAREINLWETSKLFVALAEFWPLTCCELLKGEISRACLKFSAKMHLIMYYHTVFVLLSIVYRPYWYVWTFPWLTWWNLECGWIADDTFDIYSGSQSEASLNNFWWPKPLILKSWEVEFFRF